MEAARAIDKKILVVEDEPDLLEALDTALRVAGGFTVFTAADGETAVEVALREKPDLIFLDIRIPKLNGSEVLERIRADEGWGARVPVSILTAQSDLSVVSAAIAIGGPNTDYLTKTDWSLEKLVEHVNQRLNITE